MQGHDASTPKRTMAGAGAAADTSLVDTTSPDAPPSPACPPAPIRHTRHAAAPGDVDPTHLSYAAAIAAKSPEVRREGMGRLQLEKVPDKTPTGRA